MLEHQIEQLRAGGCREIILVGGDHNLKEARRLFPKLKCIRQKDLDLGMRGALLSALPSCKKESVMIVSANDVVEPAAYSALRDAASRPGVMGAILAKTVKHYFPGGYLKVKGNRALSIVEKPGEGKEPSNLVNIVAHIHNDASIALKELKNVSAKNDDGYERALTGLMKSHAYHVVRYSGLWQAVKYPWHLLHVLPIFLEHVSASIHRSATIHPSAVIEGNVTIEEGVKVLPQATMVGPVTIGKNSIIGTGALVRGSSIGENCVIGFGSEIKSSILAHDVWTHMTYLGDSIVGGNVAFGGGTITGNFRLDEGEISSVVDGKSVPTGLTKLGAIVGANTRIGIRVGTNPGIKIGEGSFIGGGLFLESDVPDGSFVTEKLGTIHVRPNRASAPAKGARNRYRSNT